MGYIRHNDEPPEVSETTAQEERRLRESTRVDCHLPKWINPESGECEHPDHDNVDDDDQERHDDPAEYPEEERAHYEDGGGLFHPLHDHPGEAAGER